MRLYAALARQGATCDLHVATVDHGLRAGSRAEAARDCGLAHSILPWEGDKPSTRIQERARAARYALLGAKAREIGASVLLTAHTLDDQAETVLMRIAHGSGLAGLAGMRALSKREGLVHARPLLGIAKARLLATCQANGWPFIEDPSNADPRYARTRWRKLAPLLEPEGLTAQRLAKLAERAASAEEALETKAGEAFEKALIGKSADCLTLDLARLVHREPRDIALRVLLRALAQLQGQGLQGEGLQGQGLQGCWRCGSVRLERVEAILEALRSSVVAGRALKRTIAGALLAYDGERELSLTCEGPRRRGRGTAGNRGPARAARAPTASHAKEGNSNARLVLV
jgi:tRNA(Ile)-lysidine synthase